MKNYICIQTNKKIKYKIKLIAQNKRSVKAKKNKKVYPQYRVIGKNKLQKILIFKTRKTNYKIQTVNK